KWNQDDPQNAYRIAEWWADVLAWELANGRPEILVVMGNRTRRLLDHLSRSGLVEPPRRLMSVWSYAYVASRPDAARKLGPMHPVRLAEYDQQFEAVARAASEARSIDLSSEKDPGGD